MSIEKVSGKEAGCWIDGHWGQYAGAKLILIASECGYDNWEVVDSALRIIRSIGSSDDYTKGDDWERVELVQDDVEKYLNLVVAPHGFSFGWHDGEFFYHSDEWWEEI